MQLSCRRNSADRRDSLSDSHLSRQHAHSPAGARLFPFKGHAGNWGSQWFIDLGRAGVRRRKRGTTESCGKRSHKEHVANAWWEGTMQASGHCSSKNKQPSEGHFCVTCLEKQIYMFYFFLIFPWVSEWSALFSLQHSPQIFTFWLPWPRQLFPQQISKTRTSGWEHAARQDFATQEHFLSTL